MHLAGAWRGIEPCTECAHNAVSMARQISKGARGSRSTRSELLHDLASVGIPSLLRLRHLAGPEEHRCDCTRARNVVHREGARRRLWPWRKHAARAHMERQERFPANAALPRLLEVARSPRAQVGRGALNKCLGKQLSSKLLSQAGQPTLVNLGAMPPKIGLNLTHLGRLWPNLAEPAPRSGNNRPTNAQEGLEYWFPEQLWSNGLSLYRQGQHLPSGNTTFD